MVENIFLLVEKALTDKINPSNADELRFIQEIAVLTSGVFNEYVSDLEEANIHLQETIHRLTKEG